MPPRAAAVFQDRMWIIAGRDQANVSLCDVWYSYDGRNWTLATSCAPFLSRVGHGVTGSTSRMWLFGGGENGADVWWSSNGANWTLATLSAPWPNRQISAALTFDGKLWLVGGYKALNESMKKEAMTDVWYSADGSEWQASTLNAQWGPRYGAQALVFKNRFACTLTVSC